MPGQAQPEFVTISHELERRSPVPFPWVKGWSFAAAVLALETGRGRGNAPRRLSPAARPADNRPNLNPSDKEES